MFDALMQFLLSLFQYVLDVILYIPVKLWDWFVDQVMIPGIIWIYSLIPTDYIDFSAIPSGVAYFLGVFNFTTGVAMILGAWLIRFMIRRIPVIG